MLKDISMTKIKAVLFDMDGVLIDAKEWHYEALNKALLLFGFEISRQDHLLKFDGLPTKKKLEILSSEGNLPISLHDFINDMKQEYTLQTSYVNCKPSFNQLNALTNLKKEGYRLAACSNSIRNTMTMLFDRAQMHEYFEFYISNEDVINAKPDPEMYNVAIKKMGLKPKECLILEDNENGIKAAIQSGGHLMKIAEINEVNYENIINFINSIENTS